MLLKLQICYPKLSEYTMSVSSQILSKKSPVRRCAKEAHRASMLKPVKEVPSLGDGQEEEE